MKMLITAFADKRYRSPDAELLYVPRAVRSPDAPVRAVRRPLPPAP